MTLIAKNGPLCRTQLLNQRAECEVSILFTRAWMYASIIGVVRGMGFAAVVLGDGVEVAEVDVDDVELELGLGLGLSQQEPFYEKRRLVRKLPCILCSFSLRFDLLSSCRSSKKFCAESISKQRQDPCYINWGHT